MVKMSRALKERVKKEHERVSGEACRIILSFMKASEITQSDMARMIGVSRQNVFTLLSGRRRLSLRVILRFACLVGARLSIRALNDYLDLKALTRKKAPTRRIPPAR